ncbi:MAG: hypothetical protein FWB72_05780 [Firmicutes bacterium]|nr:hypothetical protein [Bacillota bacterium]
MKKLYETKLLMYSLGLLISSMIERVITHFINENLNLEPAIYHTISLVLLIILFLTTNILLKWAMKSKLACRLAFGKAYVAGRWVEVVYCPDKSHIGYAVFDISYDDDGVTILGTNYDLELNVAYTFTSKSASLENYVLNYMFLRNINGQQVPDWGSLTFQRNVKSPPSVYTGNFKRDEQLFRFTGYLVKETKDLYLLDKDFIGNFKQVLAKYSNKPMLS